jgi:cyclohexanone monooxygenase
MVVSIEQHIDWIADAIDHLNSRNLTNIEATTDAQDAWVAHVNELAEETLYPQASSWYLGSNITGKARVFMPYVNGCGNYRGECEAVVRDGYRGFQLTAGSVVQSGKDS